MAHRDHSRELFIVFFLWPSPARGTRSVRGMAHEPIAIDLFCGLGGWTEGLLQEGYRVIGFDIERHHYGDARYPAQLVLQDVLTIHGSQFRSAALIVASPPCQAYSYRAMPWKRAKALPPPDNSLFEACFRIQREAIAAAGHHIPLVVENVCGAQKWVGRARWHYGSFYLWGDVPALMPITRRAAKVPGLNWNGSDKPGYVAQAFNTTAEQRLLGRKASPGGKDGWFGDYQTMKDGIKQHGSGREWFAGDGKISRLTSSDSPARKAASAHIAKIPLPLAQHIARMWKPIEATA